MGSLKNISVILVIFITSLLLNACAIFTFTPDLNTESRLHPLGMSVYNQTGKPLDEYLWKNDFIIIGEAYKILRECVGKINETTESELRTTPIVIIPAEEIEIDGSPAWAFTDNTRIFVRSDKFNGVSLRNEWMHRLLWLSGKALFGDPGHHHKLFKKCDTGI